MPVVVRTAVRAPFLLPEKVGALAEVLFVGTIPVFVGSVFWAACLFPKEVGTLTNDLIETQLRLGRDIEIIAVRSQSSAPTYMHLGS